MRIDRAAVERVVEHKPYVNGRIITVTRRLREIPELETIDLSDALLDN